ncbi:hypothetical protein MVEN_00498600 [Mycena venus]|uniref:Uncharacterized protein n=1 Tax=Mycena venus TaxID=2733690 RepID=A0A8H6YWW7_9AGAR|nr:hypothetical protein MVEN_00498600 [Mycena venus]
MNCSMQLSFFTSNQIQGGLLPPSMLNYIGKFTETLQKIHIFVEAQQHGLDFFRLKNTSIMTDFHWGIYDEQGLFSISKQLSIHLNASLRAQDIPWP